MRFKIEKGALCDTRVEYDKADSSFDSADAERPEGFTSILVNDLNIELDDSGRLLYVWGLCPSETWQPFDQRPNNIIDGRVSLLDGVDELTPGISKRLNKQTRWPVNANKVNGWVCIGDAYSQGEVVRFANNVAATIQNGELVAIWVKLSSLPTGHGSQT